MTQQVTGLPQGVTHVSPVYPLEQVPVAAPVAKPPRPPWVILVAAVAGGAIAWLGASGYYGAADVRAMRQELAQAQAAMQQQQQQIDQVKGSVCP
jgi:uncharacterized membrane protein (DUF106 family)